MGCWGGLRAPVSEPTVKEFHGIAERVYRGVGVPQDGYSKR